MLQKEEDDGKPKKTGVPIQEKSNFSTMPNRYDPSAINNRMLKMRSIFRESARSIPYASQSEIPLLHKPAVYDKKVFRPPGARKREEVTAWRGILSSE